MQNNSSSPFLNAMPLRKFFEEYSLENLLSNNLWSQEKNTKTDRSTSTPAFGTQSSCTVTSDSLTLCGTRKTALMKKEHESFIPTSKFPRSGKPVSSIAKRTVTSSRWTLTSMGWKLTKLKSVKCRYKKNASTLKKRKIGLNIVPLRKSPSNTPNTFGIDYMEIFAPSLMKNMKERFVPLLSHSACPEILDSALCYVVPVAAERPPGQKEMPPNHVFLYRTLIN